MVRNVAPYRLMIGSGLISASVIGTLCTALFGLALVLGIFDSFGQFTQTTFQEVVTAIGMLSFFLIFAFEVLDKLYEDAEGRYVIQAHLNRVFGADGYGPRYWGGTFFSEVLSTVVIFAVLFAISCAGFYFAGLFTFPMLIVLFVFILYVALPDTGNDYWLMGLWMFCVVVGFYYNWIQFDAWFKSQTVIIPLIQGFLGGI